MSRAVLFSMTGYGRADGQWQDWAWVWEIKSVNGRSLDTRLRLPPGFEALEFAIRKIIATKIRRGNLQISLDITARPDGGIAINKDLLKQLLKTAGELADSPVDIAGLMTIKGVVEERVLSAGDEKFTRRNAKMLASLKLALAQLSKTRKQEGKALAKILSGQIDEFARLLDMAKSCKGANKKFIENMFRQKLAELLQDDLPEERISQEAAILAVKADISEELGRLGAHINQVRKLLKSGSPIGRKLDFLAQEFIREINTLCSKSNDIGLTNTGLDMKAVIEQFREQAANVE